MSNDEYQRLLTMYNNTTNPFIKAALHERMEELSPNKDSNGIIFLGMKYESQDKNDDTYYFPNRNTNYQVPIRDKVNNLHIAKNKLLNDIKLERFRLNYLITRAVDEVISYYEKRIKPKPYIDPYEYTRSIERRNDVENDFYDFELKHLGGNYTLNNFEEGISELNETLNQLCRDANKLIRDGTNLKTDI